MQQHLENTLNPCAVRPLVVNTRYFGGIFPHKGEKCVKILPSWRYDRVRWTPINGRKVIVARQRTCSPGYVPAECLDPEWVSSNSRLVWTGNLGTKLVWKKDFPAEGVKLVKDWRAYACYGPSEEKFTVPAGTVIIAGDGGDAAQAGYHWEA